MSRLNQEEKDALDRLAAENRLDPDTLLKEAEVPTHPCHHRFEWDDEEAAKQYRLGQSHQTIAIYHITMVEETREVKYRKYTYVSSEGRYLDGDEAVSNFRAELVEALVRDTRTLVGKHRRLGLEEILAAVELAWGPSG